MISKRQKEVFDFIKNFISKKKYSPSLEEIRDHFGLASVSTAHHHVKVLVDLGLISHEENQPRGISINTNEPLTEIPLVGTIAAGYPIEAIAENESIAVPKSKLPRNGTLFALRVKGDSMVDENIEDGDIVISKSQSIANNGQRVVALVDNQEVTLKKYYQEKNQIRLQPANKNYEPLILKAGRLQIQGVVVDVVKTNKADETYLIPSIENIERPSEPKSIPKNWLNSIQYIDCVEGMKKLPDSSIDFVVTSPPYDSVRNYNGFSYDLHQTGKELFRVLKDGGIVAMVIQDQTKDFGKSLTSFRTIIDWCDNIGFKLFETVIYKKHGAEGAWWTKRFRVDHEYIPIFLKGKRPQYFDKEHLKIPSKHGGKTMTGCATRLTSGITMQSKKVTINPFKCRGTIWDYVTCGDGTRLKHQHPATFPDMIPYDLIKCFCPVNGIVLDPFIGSGTTALAAIKLNKKYLGFDISKEYCDLAVKRINEKNNSESEKKADLRLGYFAFSTDLNKLVTNTKQIVEKQFRENNEYYLWKSMENNPTISKFCIETAYCFLNEMILLWIARDKNIIDFNTISGTQQFLSNKHKIKALYANIFENNLFDWFGPTESIFLKISTLFNKFDFSKIDRDLLGKIYEKFISVEERKSLGQFYTPDPIIDYILDQTGYKGKDIVGKKIIDISCGSGGFLSRAANRLVCMLKREGIKNEEIMNKVTSSIYGLDINPFARYLAETNILIQLLDLIIEAKQENPEYKVPKIKIFQTNTIETPSLLSTEDQEIKNIKNKAGESIEGFDFVVGNPPYLEAKKMDKKTKELCIETCPNVISGAFDLFICFISKGLYLLKNGGKFGYIIPNKFLIANYAQKMRDEILDHFSIKEIIDVSECEVFENVSVYPVIIVIDNNKPIDNTIKTAERINHTRELESKNFPTNKIPQSIYKRDDRVFFILPSNRSENDLLMKLLGTEFQTLDKYLTVKWTISFHASGLREKFLFSEKPNSENAKKLIGGKSFAGNNDINRYKLEWGGWWIDYNEDLARKHKNQLPPRPLFEQEKLIICQNALRLRAAFDDKGYYCKDTFFVAALNNEVKNDFNLKYFLALLNSKLLHYYYANIYKGTHVAGGYLHYLIGYLNSLPVAIPTKKQQLEIVALVEDILKGGKEFSRIDNQIDKLIYKLYKLDNREIKIVESFI